MKLLCIDTETTGLHPDKASLISVGMAVWEDGLIRGTKQINIKPEFYKIEPRYIKNDFLIKEHEKHAITPDKFKKEFVSFLRDNFISHDKIMLLGHNLQFDIKFLKTELSEDFMNQIFGTQVIDTCGIIRYLVQCGKLPENIAPANIWQHFELKPGDNTEEGVISICKLYNKLIELVRE